jgi:hypothetical protein
MPAHHTIAAKMATTPRPNTQLFRCCGIVPSREVFNWGPAPEEYYASSDALSTVDFGLFRLLPRDYVWKEPTAKQIGDIQIKQQRPHHSASISMDISSVRRGEDSEPLARSGTDSTATACSKVVSGALA